MGKFVQVKFNGKTVSAAGSIVTRDLTPGKTYGAYVPSEGEVDPDGLSTCYPDELWITEDDVGAHVVTRLSEGFELVE